MTSEVRRTVFAYLDGETVAVPAGILTMREQGNVTVSSVFGYGAGYLRRVDAIPVDPVSLPLEDAVPGSRHEYEPVGGLTLFGAVRDAMPDLWGRRVIENRLQVPPNSLGESTYMQYAGSNRLGALDFRDTPTSPEQDGVLAPVTDLADLLAAADRIQQGEPVPAHLAQLFDAGPSMGGARPKAVVLRGSVQYVAKFPALDDGFDVPVIERATLELARRCGLRVPATDLVPLPDGRTAMLIERFDRVSVDTGWQRKPVVSGPTMLGLHESESPNASYADLSRVLGRHGASGHVASDRAELFGRMVFNILVGNDDDHLRNHAFVRQAGSRGWRLSPLYDVVPKPQIATDRYLHLGVGKRGRLATLDNAMSDAAQFGLMEKAAHAVVERIAGQVREWRTSFEEAGVPPDECEKVASAFRRPRDLGWT